VSAQRLAVGCSALTGDFPHQLVTETLSAPVLKGVAEGARQLGAQRSSEARIDRARLCRAEQYQIIDGRATLAYEDDGGAPRRRVRTTGSQPRIAILVKSSGAARALGDDTS
jgi:hypothetical protein